MIDKETYGLEVEAKTSKAKKAFSDLANFIRDFGKQAEKETTLQPRIDPSISKQELFKWQKDLQNSIKEAKLDVKNFKGTPTGHYYEEDLKRYQEGLELVDNRIKEIEEDEANAKEELEEMGSQGEKSTSILSGLFDKSIGKIKRFTYYLLGARSVFSLFMKYQSIYYQYNEQMQYQSELSQNAIALSLAPAFEFLGNVIAYASIAFAKFIELLTGVNVLSKVSTKGIRDYNKALKESHSLLSGIDEITNLTLPSSTGLAGQYKALDEFQKKVAEVEKFFKENKWIQDLVNGLKKVFSWISDTYNFIHDHWDVFKYIFGGVALGALLIKIGTSVTGLGAVLGATSMVGVAKGTGLLGLAGALKYIIGLGAIVITISTVMSGYKALKEYRDTLIDTQRRNEESAKTYKKLLEEYPDIMDEYLDRLNETQKGTDKWQEKAKEVKDVLKDALQNIVDGKLEYEDYQPAVDQLIKKLQKLNAEDFKAEIDFLAQLNTNDAKKSYELLVAYMKTNAPKVTLGTAGGGNKASGGGAFSGGGSRGTTTTTQSTSKSGSVIKDLITGLILKPLGFANGLDYVPYDEFPALLHKGEAVVPAKYNPTIHSEGNDYTNTLLETLVMKVDDLSKRPNVFEIDGQQFANATYGLYEDANNRQGYVKEVVR